MTKFFKGDLIDANTPRGSITNDSKPVRKFTSIAGSSNLYRKENSASVIKSAHLVIFVTGKIFSSKKLFAFPFRDTEKLCLFEQTVLFRTG